MRRYTITVNDTTRVIDVEEVTADTYRVKVEGRFVDVRLDDHRGLAHAAIAPTVEVARASVAEGSAARQGEVPAGGSDAPRAAAAPAASTPPSRPAVGPAPTASAGRTDRMTAPMPGVVLEVRTAPGTRVARGETVAILEAMKMKNELKAPRDGVVAEVFVAAGQQVKYGEALLRFEES